MSNKTDIMSPDSSPNQPNQFGGKRVNNLPLIILAVFFAVFLAIVMLVGMDRAKLREADEEEQKPAEDSSEIAQLIVGDMKDGFIDPVYAVTKSPNTQQEAQQIAVLADSNLATDTNTLPQTEDPWATERKVIKQNNFKMLTEAITSKTPVPFKPVKTSIGNIGSDGSSRAKLLEKIANAKKLASQVETTDPTTAYKTRLAALNASGLIGEGNTSTGGGNNKTNNFGDSLFDLGDDWRLKNKIKAPETAFTLRAGSVIPGIMITGINSELPGRISGQISQNVYDTPMGIHLLLPQGTKIDGSYINHVAYGQSRLLIAWNRLIFPDGKALDIGTMPGTDSAGYSGFTDEVDNHYFRIYGSAFLMSGITAAMSYGTRDDVSDSEKPFSDTLSESLATNLGETTLAMISKNLNLSPTLNIRPGYRFNILVVKDMAFKKPYQQFDY